MLERKQYLERHRDELRQQLLFEPRGQPALSAVLLTRPADPGADLGILIMEGADYPPMSGTNTINSVTVALETGILPMYEPVTELVLDTPGGIVLVAARCHDGKCESVTFDNVPSFCTAARRHDRGSATRNRLARRCLRRPLLRAGLGDGPRLCDRPRRGGAAGGARRTDQARGRHPARVPPPGRLRASTSSDSSSGRLPRAPAATAATPRSSARAVSTARPAEPPPPHGSRSSRAAGSSPTANHTFTRGSCRRPSVPRSSGGPGWASTKP